MANENIKTSWQARLANAYFKMVVRTHRWGDEKAVAKRANRLFGAPKLWQWLKSRGVCVEQVTNETVRGEWLTAKNAEQAVILYIHGGGFVAGSTAGHRPITASLARLGRYNVFSLDYRLAPKNRFPAALDDAVAAYLWLLEQKFNPRQIAVAGDSAGGGLVLSTLLKLQEENIPLPSSAVCFSPWTDLAGTGDSMQSNGKMDAMFCPENIPEFASAYLGEASPFDKYASPVFAEFDATFPPILFQVGSTEVLLDDSRRIHDQIQKAGGKSELEIYENTPHCWQILDSFVPEARTALENAVKFIGRHLSSK